MVAHESGRRLLTQAGKSGFALLADEDLESFVHDHFGDTHTLSVPRQRFLAVGGYPPGFKVCEDVHLLIRLCAVSRRVGVVCTPLEVYCVYEYSATRSDRLRAQRYNLETLLDLDSQSGAFPAPVRRGGAAAAA